jgi:hypothetical protein
MSEPEPERRDKQARDFEQRGVVTDTLGAAIGGAAGGAASSYVQANLSKPKDPPKTTNEPPPVTLE